MARLLKTRGYEIVTAFNADKSGDRMAERLRELLGGEVRRDRPSSDHGKDWNEQLKIPTSRAARRARTGARPPHAGGGCVGGSRGPGAVTSNRRRPPIRPPSSSRTDSRRPTTRKADGGR